MRLFIPVIGAGPSYDPAAKALFVAFAAAGAPASSAYEHLYDRYIRALKAGAVWEACDVIPVLATYASAAALINVRNPGTNNLTISGSPTFTANQGFTGDGTAFLDTGYIPDGNGAYKQNSAHISVYIRSNVNEAASVIGAGVGANRAFINPRNSSLAAANVNHTAAGSALQAANTAAGHFHAQRTAAGAQALFLDDVSLASNGTASTGLPASSFTLLKANGSASISTRQLSMASIGGALSAAQRTAKYNADIAFLTGAGAI